MSVYDLRNRGNQNPYTEAETSEDDSDLEMQDDDPVAQGKLSNT